MPIKGKENKKAVAMAYLQGDVAPKVIAKGCGPTAEAIITLARENGIYVHESRELLELLMHVELDRYIPHELYQAIAELLAWVYSIERTLEKQG